VKSQIGTTSQLVTPEGNYLGGLIDYRQTDMSKFFEMIAAIGQYAHKQGYFGVIGFDVLEDQDGQFYAIDANFRVNGSTPLCLQRNTLLSLGKGVASVSDWLDKNPLLQSSAIAATLGLAFLADQAFKKEG